MKLSYYTNVISFAPNGKIYSCLVLATHDICPLGNYLDPYLDLNAISQIKRRNILNLKKCHDCNLLPICGGGCLFKALKNTKIDIWKQTTCMPRNIFEEEMSKFVATNIKIRKEKEVK